MKSPRSIAQRQVATQKRYCLKFGTVGLEQERIEIRNASFERIGHCAVHDLPQIAAWLGCAADDLLQQRIAAIPHGQITAIEL